MDIRRNVIILLIGSIIYFMGSVLVALVIREDYRFYEQFLSILGTGPQGWIFNIPVMLLGIATILFYPQFFRAVSDLFDNYLVLLVGTILGEVTSFLLFFIGFFPVEGDTADIHNTLAVLYFLLLMIQMVVFSIAITFTLQKTPKVEGFNAINYLGYLIGVAIFVGFFGPGYLSYTLQKVIVLLTMIYLGMMARINWKLMQRI